MGLCYEIGRQADKLGLNSENTQNMLRGGQNPSDIFFSLRGYGLSLLLALQSYLLSTLNTT